MKNHRFFVAAAAALLPIITIARAETPVAYWSFDNSANDSAGTLHGILNGTAAYNASVPTPLAHSTASLDLNAGGANDGFFSATPTTTLSGTFTLSLWSNLGAFGTVQNFFSTRIPGETSFDAKVSNAGLIHGDIGNGSGWIDTSADAAFVNQAGAWNHFVYVVRPTGYSIFANGIEIGREAFGANTPLLWDANHQIRIGQYNSGVETYSGKIDDVAVYNTALTPKQIAALSAGAAPLTLAPTAAGRSYHGAVVYTPVSNDADSGINTGISYTHKLDFGTSGTATVNGVAFNQGTVGGGVTINYGNTVPNAHPGNGDHNTSGGLADLMQDMNFNNPDGFVSLSGLTIGQSYKTRLFMRNWAAAGTTFDRTQKITFDTDGDGVPERLAQVNPDDPRAKGAVFDGDHQAFTLDYTFVADSPILRIGMQQLGGGSYHLYGLTNEASDRLPIKIYNTGVDNNGNRLSNGVIDPHFTLVSSPTPGDQPIAIQNHPAWVANDLNSGFLGTAASGNGADAIADGLYVFQQTFDLSGLNPDTAELYLTLFADNELTVFLNGVDTGIFHSGFGFLDGTHSTISAGFQSGINTLEFRMINQPPAGPGGFVADVSGTAQIIPEPGTAALLLLGLATCIRRKRR